MMESQGVEDAVTAAIREWTTTGTSRIEARHSLTEHLRSELVAAGWERTADRVTSITASKFCDIGVGATVGVKLYTEFTTVTARQLRQLAWRDELPYDHLVLVGHGLPENHRDTWRIVETRIATASESPEVQSIEFVLSGGSSDVSTAADARTIWRYAEPVAGLLLLLVGSVAAATLRIDFGNATLVVAVLVTVLASLVLVSMLGLLTGDTA
jgi:CHASE2 domain-containing sensor protein